MPHRRGSSHPHPNPHIHHAPAPRPRLYCIALRDALALGYSKKLFRSDLLAGLVVGVVALPLCIALAIAVGMPPSAGIATGIVAGFIAALCGGSAVQVTGPTAAFVVVLAPVVSQLGPAGLLVSSLIAGAILLVMGIARLGRLVEFVPFPVTAGFTLGIAVVIGMLQLKDLLGLTFENPHENIARIIATVRALPSARVGDAAVGLGTLGLLLLWPRLNRRIPAALVALPIATIVGILLSRLGPQWQISTIDARFGEFVDGLMVRGGIPSDAASFLLPWNAPGPSGEHMQWDWQTAKSLSQAAVAIAVLGAIESLLSAVIADGATGRRHDPDGELVGQGLANLAAPFFGGFAATGALARTSANIRAGAKSPVSGMVHAGFLLLAVLVFAPALGYLPMSALAAVLLAVAVGMAEVRHCWFIVRHAPRGDSLTLVTCFTLTVAFDMVVAVFVGIVLASLLFMRRMAELATVELVAANDSGRGTDAPPGVVYYRIRGPLFFGAAQRAMSELEVKVGARAIVIDLKDVPMMDATGLINLESAVERLNRAGMEIILCSVADAPRRVMRQAHFPNDRLKLRFAQSLPEAFALAKTVAG